MVNTITHISFVEENDWLLFEMIVDDASFICAFEHTTVAAFLDKCEGTKTQEWLDLDHIIRSAVLMKTKHRVVLFSLSVQLLGHLPARVPVITVETFCKRRAKGVLVPNTNSEITLML